MSLLPVHQNRGWAGNPRNAGASVESVLMRTFFIFNPHSGFGGNCVALCHPDVIFRKLKAGSNHLNHRKHNTPSGTPSAISQPVARVMDGFFKPFFMFSKMRRGGLLYKEG